LSTLTEGLKDLDMAKFTQQGPKPQIRHTDITCTVCRETSPADGVVQFWRSHVWQVCADCMRAYLQVRDEGWTYYEWRAATHGVDVALALAEPEGSA
jgi:hypothetical protein